MLLNPAVANYFQLGLQPLAGSAADVVVRSPLHLFMLGNEAVFVFFVLSGVVLTLQANAVGFEWARYFPRRILRLYLPALASLVLAVTAALVFHSDRDNASYWVQISTFSELRWRDVLTSAELLYGNPVLNGPLWSLRWEILFSVLLPVFVLIARAPRWVPVATIALAPAVMWLGIVAESAPLEFLPAFAVGVAIVRFVRERPNDGRTLHGAGYHARWIAALLFSIALLLARYVLEPYVDSAANDALFAVVVVGAAGLVLVAARWLPAVTLLSTPIAAWFGRISFSLYLVHVVVIVALANALPDLPWQFVAIIGVVLSIGIAVLFERFVERPSHLLSRRVGQAQS